MSTELASRIKNSKQNVGLFLGTGAGMMVATTFSAFFSGISSPGTILAASIVGLFTGLTLASRQRLKTLESTKSL